MNGSIYWLLKRKLWRKLRPYNVDPVAIRIMLSWGIDPDDIQGPPGSKTVLHWLSFNDVSESDGIVDRLLTAGANPDCIDYLGSTPLIEASRSGRIGIVERLLDAGADPDYGNPLNRMETAMMAAAYAGHRNVVERLARTATLDLRNAEGMTALMYAAWGHHASAIEVLADHGADINARDNEGRTALSHAAWWPGHDGSQSVIRSIVSHGGDPKIRAQDGRTPSEVSELYFGFDKVAAALEESADGQRTQHGTACNRQAMRGIL